MHSKGVQALALLGHNLVSNSPNSVLILKNEGSLNSCINKQLKWKKLDDALELYQKMRTACPCFTGFTLVSLVHACAELRDVRQGQEIHAEISRKGLLDTDIYAGNALINLYIRCGSLLLAQEVFNNLHIRDVVTWTTIIGGFVTHGYGLLALKLFEQMQEENHNPNNVTYIWVIKACGSIANGGIGKALHDAIEKNMMLRNETAVNNSLVDMYVKCGLMTEGQKVFSQLIVHDKISWSALIMGYVDYKKGLEAMECFQQMLVEGVILDSVGYACSLKAFSSAQNLKAIQEMHAVVIGLDLLVVYPLIGNTLMDAYICCASLKEAQKLFQKLQARDIVSWNTLVDGHIRQGHGEDALQWTGRMLIEGMSPDSVTLVCSLRACGITRLLCRGKNLHAAIALAEVGLLIGNALIDMYFKCGSITDAYKIFSVLKHRDVVSWTSLIAGYVSNGSAEESLICFQHMLADGIAPNTATFACVLKACGQMKAVRKGIEMHTEIERRGLSALDIAVGNALVDMYSKCDMLEAAFEVFDLVPAKNVASWNTLIAVYMKHGYAAQALDCLKLMLADGIRPNSITYISSLKACGYMGILTEGIELHTEIARNGLLLKDASVGNALVDMYIHHGLLTRAMEVFNELPDQSQICWTSLLAGFVEHDQGREALCFFDRMQLKGLSPDAATYVCSLKACRAVGAVNKGREIHAEVARCSLLGDELIGNSLIGMYADCGLLAIAHEVFDMLHRQNKVAWTALIAGHVRQGDLDSAILAFERMRQGKECPDAVTLLWILMAFAQAGEVERGQMYFETMDKVYGISPNLEHCTCVVDLFCRAGFTDMASALIEKMSLEVDPVVWCTFLDACQKSGNVEAGVKAFEHIVQIGAMDPSPKLSISNLHASIEEKETFIVVREKAGNEHMTYGGVNEEDSVLSLLEACL